MYVRHREVATKLDRAHRSQPPRDKHCKAVAGCSRVQSSDVSAILDGISVFSGRLSVSVS